MTYDTDKLTPAEALREAADELGHDAEYNMTVAMRWSSSRQAANNALILKVRALHARADALEKGAK